MKLNRQRMCLYVFADFNEDAGFKVVPICEDMDEANLHYNVNSEKRPIFLDTELLFNLEFDNITESSLSVRLINMLILLSDDAFYDAFFEEYFQDKLINNNFDN